MSGYESDTCGRSYTTRIRYMWMQILLYPHKKICGYKNLRIRVDEASGLSLRGRGWGFAQATKNAAPGYFHRKMEEK